MEYKKKLEEINNNLEEIIDDKNLKEDEQEIIKIKEKLEYERNKRIKIIENVISIKKKRIRNKRCYQ